VDEDPVAVLDEKPEPSEDPQREAWGEAESGRINLAESWRKRGEQDATEATEAVGVMAGRER